MQDRLVQIQKLLLIVLATFLLTASSLEFWNITWGTGEWLGLFSFKWAIAFFLFVLFCILCLSGLILGLWQPGRFSSLSNRSIALRDKLGRFRWVVIALFLVLPVWFLQYTAWGIIIKGPYLRLMIWILSTGFIGIILTQTREKPITWLGFLPALVLTSGTTIFTFSLTNVTSYPFSLWWSEGNRWWDYSLLFGRDIYIYPADKPIPVLLDLGRQLIGGIPFLFPGVTIWQARLWAGLVNVVPYLILGLIAFKTSDGSRKYWILAGIWAMTFVIQGPIHPPLLLCAIFTAFAWRKPLWLAVPLILVTSYFAEISRFTWLFAPGMWAGMLELSGALTQDNKLSKTAWVRAVSVGMAGIAGGYFAPFLVPSWIARFTSLFQETSAEIVSNLGTGVSLEAVGVESSAQPLLWYRLLPNATYGFGIVLGLFFATAPLIVVLIYLSVTRRWTPNLWQKLAIAFPLLAFLVVGLIVSVKIGGGGDLHNMDMFIIGLMFAGAIAWRQSGHEWILQSNHSPVWIHIALFLMVGLPAYSAYMYLSPIRVAEEDMPWVMTLADISPDAPFLELLPYERDATKALGEIRAAVEQASPHGEILFMDQRQLLTFGYITGVPLVPEYDKKVLINYSLSGDAQYFAGFYSDLASQRFSLIITQPLHEKLQSDTDQFGEENNAWVKWVSAPVLCFYEPLVIMRKVRIELLVPRQDISGCTQYLNE